jgi:hypothetical protein
MQETTSATMAQHHHGDPLLFAQKKRRPRRVERQPHAITTPTHNLLLASFCRNFQKGFMREQQTTGISPNKKHQQPLDLSSQLCIIY